MPRGGGTQLFFRYGCAARFFEVWNLRTDTCLWKGGLVNWKFPNLGLVNWGFPNLGACELKISIFGGLWAEFWMKIEAVEAKFSNFLKRGGLVNWLFCLKWDPCELQERRDKGVFRAAHPHTPFLGQCPPLRVKWRKWRSMLFSTVIFQIWLLKSQIFEFKPVHTHHKTEIEYDLSEDNYNFFDKYEITNGVLLFMRYLVNSKLW